MKTFDSNRREFLKLSCRALATGQLVAATGCGTPNATPAPKDWLNLGDAEDAARAHLGWAEFQALSGGEAADERYQANRAGLDGFVLRPRVLVDVSRLDLSISLLGRMFDAPILVGPGVEYMGRGVQMGTLRGATAANTSVILNGSISDDLRGAASTAGRHAMWFQPGGSASGGGELNAEVERALDTGAGGLWVVLTADHGESFGEHNNYFGRDAYQPTLHVPLDHRLARRQLRKGRRVYGRTR